MPLYEYKCKKCGHRFELIQGFSAEDTKECPVCQGEAERLISTPARPHFKGTGFYSTDYGAKPSKSQDGASASDSSGKGSAEKVSAAKTETTTTPAAPATTTTKSD